MKRVLAIALAIIMILSFSVSVSADPKPYGKTNPDGSRKAVPVPKVTTAPTIDGLFYDLYNEKTLTIPITRDSNGGDRQEMGDVYGFAYVVYDDYNLYIYVKCYDPTPWNVLDYIEICPYCGKQKGAPKYGESEECTHFERVGKTNIWNDDCVEIIVDFTDSGEDSQVSGYRVSRNNLRSRGYDTWNLGFTGAAIEFYGGEQWGAEFAIPLKNPEKGTKIGINGMIHSQNSTEDSPSGKNSETIAYFDNSAERGTLLEAEFYDYIVLGDYDSPGNYGTGFGGTCGENLRWKYDTGTLTIGGTGEMDNYFSHRAPWYNLREKITDVIIDEGVTSIGESTFEDCKSIISISIPDSVTSIGRSAFYGCTSLKDITLTDSITNIGPIAFDKCSSLENITIPNGVTEIKPYTFSDCSSLASITIPDGVTDIGECAFYGCTSIKSVKIPDCVTNIGDFAFLNCTSLNDITLTDSITNIGCGAFGKTAYYNDPANWTDNILYIGNHLIEADTSLAGEYSVREGTKTIAGSSFCDCKSLTGIIIPDGVTGIGYYAFDNCISLSGIEIPDSVKSINKDALSDCDMLTIYGSNGSYAQEYANEHNIPFKTGTILKDRLLKTANRLRPEINCLLTLHSINAMPAEYRAPLFITYSSLYLIKALNDK